MKGPEGVKETAQQRAFAAIGAKMYEIGDKTFRPLERQMIDRVKDDKFDRTKAAGDANAAVRKQFGMAKEQVAKSQTAAGARPGSGRFTEAVAQTETDAGTAAGFTGNDIQAGAEDLKAANVMNLTRQGMGQVGGAVQNLGAVASRSGNDAIARARESAAKRGMWQDTAAAAIGAGAYGMSKMDGFGAPSATGVREAYNIDQYQYPPSAP